MTIFILGCGVMQMPALRLAGEMHWTVAAADGSENAPGAPSATNFSP